MEGTATELLHHVTISSGCIKTIYVRIVQYLWHLHLMFHITILLWKERQLNT